MWKLEFILNHKTGQNLLKELNENTGICIKLKLPFVFILVACIKIYNFVVSKSKKVSKKQW